MDIALVVYEGVLHDECEAFRTVLRLLRGTSERDRLAMGERARARVLAEHTAAHRAEQLEGDLLEARRGARRTMVAARDAGQAGLGAAADAAGAGRS